MEKNRIMDYKETLNLPQTEFPMRANLAQREPATLARWDGMDLHRRMAENRKGRPTFVLHEKAADDLVRTLGSNCVALLCEGW